MNAENIPTIPLPQTNPNLTTQEAQLPVFYDMPMISGQGSGLGRVVYVLRQNFIEHTKNICDRQIENAHAFHASNFAVAGAQLIGAIPTVLYFEMAAKSVARKADDQTCFTNIEECIQNLNQAREAQYPAPSTAPHIPYISTFPEDTPEFIYMRECLEHCVTVLETCRRVLEGRSATNFGYRLFEAFGQNFGWAGWQETAKEIQTRLVTLKTLIHLPSVVLHKTSSELFNHFMAQVECFTNCMGYIALQWMQAEYIDRAQVFAIIANAGFEKLVSIDRYPYLQSGIELPNQGAEVTEYSDEEQVPTNVPGITTVAPTEDTSSCMVM